MLKVLGHIWLEYFAHISRGLKAFTLKNILLVIVMLNNIYSYDYVAA